MERSRIPNKLKYFRGCRGLSQKNVARLLGLKDTSMVSRWENGLSIPGLTQAFRLAYIFHTHPHELFDECWVSQSQQEDLLTHAESHY